MLGAFNAEENADSDAEEINKIKEDVSEDEKEDHTDVEEEERNLDSCSDDNDDDVVIESVEDIEGEQQELLPRNDEVDQLVFNVNEV